MSFLWGKTQTAAPARPRPSCGGRGSIGGGDFFAVAEVAGPGDAALGVVLLVVVLGGVEGAGGDDLGDEGADVLAGGVAAGFFGAGEAGLLVVMVEDGAAVVGANVGALAVEGGGVVVVEETSRSC